MKPKVKILRIKIRGNEVEMFTKLEVLKEWLEREQEIMEMIDKRIGEASKDDLGFTQTKFKELKEEIEK